MRKVTPEVFDLAFSYRDYGNEVDHLEYNWQKAAGSDNQRVLDIACGTGRHIEQFNLRGYDCAGMDINADMINYTREKFDCEEPKIDLFEMDMRDFTLPMKFGLAINMLASVNIIVTNEEMVSHLKSVANALENGGIYYLEMYHPREYGYSARIPARSWEIIKGDTTVQAELTYDRTKMDPMTQSKESTLKVTLTENGEDQVYYDERIIRVYLYLEFLSLVENAGGFEPVTCYGTFNSAIQLDDSSRSWRMLHVLRKTG